MEIAIYTLAHPTTKEVRYIGQTNNIVRRLKKHLKTAESSTRHISNWIRSLPSPPILTVIETCEVSVRNEREQYWIDYYKSQGYELCNASNGGAGAGLGNKNCLGRIMSEETKKKISEANKGNNYGKGNKGGASGKEVHQYDLSGNYITTFKSLLLASQVTGVCRRTIRNSLNNKLTRPQRSEYTWSYTLS